MSAQASRRCGPRAAGPTARREPDLRHGALRHVARRGASGRSSSRGRTPPPRPPWCRRRRRPRRSSRRRISPRAGAVRPWRRRDRGGLAAMSDRGQRRGTVATDGDDLAHTRSVRLLDRGVRPAWGVRSSWTWQCVSNQPVEGTLAPPDLDPREQGIALVTPRPLGPAPHSCPSAHAAPSRRLSRPRRSQIRSRSSARPAETRIATMRSASTASPGADVDVGTRIGLPRLVRLEVHVRRPDQAPRRLQGAARHDRRPSPPSPRQPPAAAGIDQRVLRGQLGVGPTPPHFEPTTVAPRDARLPRLLARSLL